jgi:Domain of unknown function (DUF6457)
MTGPGPTPQAVRKRVEKSTASGAAFHTPTGPKRTWQGLTPDMPAGTKLRGMDEWLQRARGRVAATVGDEPGVYDLSAEEIDEILELARIAAHESGERTNAPLLCYLVGLARGRTGGDLADLVDAATGASA